MDPYVRYFLNILSKSEIFIILFIILIIFLTYFIDDFTNSNATQIIIAIFKKLDKYINEIGNDAMVFEEIQEEKKFKK